MLVAAQPEQMSQRHQRFRLVRHGLLQGRQAVVGRAESSHAGPAIPLDIAGVGLPCARHEAADGRGADP